MISIFFRIIIFILVCVVFITEAPAFLSSQDIDSMIVQEGGRKKPYLVFANESFLALTGRSSIPTEDGKLLSSTAITDLWLNPFSHWKNSKLILVDNLKLRNFLKLSQKDKLYSWQELTTNELLSQILTNKYQNINSVSDQLIYNESTIVSDRIRLLESIVEGNSFQFILPQNSNNHSLNNLVIEYFHGLKESWIANSQVSFNDNAKKIISLQARVFDSKTIFINHLEILYERINPFRLSWIFYSLAFCSLLFTHYYFSSFAYSSCTTLTIIGLFFQIFGLIARMIIAERPPVTNMYESIIWLAFGLLVFTLCFEWKYRVKSFFLSTLPLATIALIIAESQPIIFNSSLQPLVPVLRNNFWLTIHVLTITLSYAAFAMSLGLAHLILIKSDVEEQKKLSQYLYTVLKIGIFLLTSGIILGAIWANYSWGRFWDWDPKETWALIALFSYLFLLHGYIRKIWDYIGLAIGAIVAFLSIIMAWYGVNFILGTGLHSYGFGRSNSLWIIFFILIEMIFLIRFVIRCY